MLLISVYQDAIISILVTTKSTKNQVANPCMVKKAMPKKIEKNVGGRPPADPETLRSERLVLRVHPDLMATLTERADEQRMTRSRFVEEILLGVLALDPRNPRFDKHGRINPQARTAAQRQLTNPIAYLNQIAAYSGLNASIFPQVPQRMPQGWTPDDDNK